MGLFSRKSIVCENLLEEVLESLDEKYSKNAEIKNNKLIIPVTYFDIKETDEKLKVDMYLEIKCDEDRNDIEILYKSYVNDMELGPLKVEEFKPITIEKKRNILIKTLKDMFEGIGSLFSSMYDKIVEEIKEKRQKKLEQKTKEK